MKHAFKLFGIVALAAAIGFSTTACENGGGSDTVPSELQGTWKSAISYTDALSFDLFYEFTANSMIESMINVSQPDLRLKITYAILDCSAAHNDNAETKTLYPAGYEIAYKIKNQEEDGIYAMTEVGDTGSSLFFLNADDTEFIAGGTSSIYAKQR